MTNTVASQDIEIVEEEETTDVDGIEIEEEPTPEVQDPTDIYGIEEEVEPEVEEEVEPEVEEEDITNLADPLKDYEIMEEEEPPAPPPEPLFGVYGTRVSLNYPEGFGVK